MISWRGACHPKRCSFQLLARLHADGIPKRFRSSVSAFPWWGRKPVPEASDVLSYSTFSARGIGRAATYSTKKDESEDDPTITDKVSISERLTSNTFRQLADLARPEWSLIGLSIGTLGVTSSVTMLLPFCSGQVIDYTIQNGQSGISPLVWAGGLLGLTCLSAGGVYLRNVWLGRAGNRIVARLKQRLLESLLRQEVAFFDKSTTSSGDLLSRLSADTGLVQATLTTQTVAGLRSAIMTLGSVGMLVVTSPTLAAVACSTLPPVFILTRHYGRSLKQQQRQVQKEQGVATALAQQALTNVTTVQQFVAERYECKRYHNAIATAHTTAVATAKSQAILESVAFVAANGAVLSVLGYGGTLVLEGTISAGDLSGFVMYALIMAGNVATLSSHYGEVLRALAAADRIFEILDRTPLIPSNQEATDAWQDPLTAVEVVFTPPAAPVNDTKHYNLHHFHKDPLSVEFCNVNFSYPSRPDVSVLNGFSVHVQPRESVALVGGSGSGKSTVAALLTRLYDVRESEIRINDKPIDTYDPHVLRNMIGVVAQQPTLVAGTIRENIVYGSWDLFSSEEERKEAIERCSDLAHVNEFSSSFPDGLDTEVGVNGSELSGGQKQRIAIARVLLKDPPLVILDEATSALDAKSEHTVHQTMRAMMNGRTVISIAHRLSTIRVADRIVVVDRGKVAQEGTYDDLSTCPGPFTDLMNTQLVK